jgi:uncharacterized protein YkwD
VTHPVTHPPVPARTSTVAAPVKTTPKPVPVKTTPKPAPVPVKTTPKPAGVTTDTAIANSVYSLLNSERRSNGLPAVARSSQLNRSAHAHNLAMASTKTFSHQVSGEAGLGSRISATGLNWTWVAENIAWSSATSTSQATSLQASMYNEAAPDNGHRLNILSTSATLVGVDVITDATGKMWITEDFGN